MSTEAKPTTTADLLSTLIDEIRGLRDDLRVRSGLPDAKIGKAKMRDWTGPSYEGQAASDCPPDFLLEYAGFLEWKAGKDRESGKDGYAAQGERVALMCRRWAAVNKHIRPAERPAFRRPAEPEQEGEAGAAPDPQKTVWSSGKTAWSKKAVGA